MDRKNPDEKTVPRQGAGQDERLRHKGEDRSTPEEKKSGPQPDGARDASAPVP